MVLPRFNLRTLLVALSVGAVISLVAGMAVRGQMWAWAITIGVLSLGVVAAVHVAWFGAAWMFSQALSVRRAAAARAMPNPDGGGTTPPSIPADARGPAAK